MKQMFLSLQPKNFNQGWPHIFHDETNISEVTQIISTLKLAFVGVPITSFDPLISPCPFARLHSPSFDIVDIDIENYNAFMKAAKALYV